MSNGSKQGKEAEGRDFDSLASLSLFRVDGDKERAAGKIGPQSRKLLSVNSPS